MSELMNNEALGRRENKLNVLRGELEVRNSSKKGGKESLTMTDQSLSTSRSGFSLASLSASRPPCLGFILVSFFSWFSGLLFFFLSSYHVSSPNASICKTAEEMIQKRRKSSMSNLPIRNPSRCTSFCTREWIRKLCQRRDSLRLCTPFQVGFLDVSVSNPTFRAPGTIARPFPSGRLLARVPISKPVLRGSWLGSFDFSSHRRWLQSGCSFLGSSWHLRTLLQQNPRHNYKVRLCEPSSQHARSGEGRLCEADERPRDAS